MSLRSAALDVRTIRAVVVLIGLVSGCNQSTPSLDESGLISLTSIATSLQRDLVENSVAVTSATQPGIIFGLNDSGHDARIFAFDSTGHARGTWKVVGARNRDWESAALGPCHTTDSTPRCFYIGDTGDNDARKSYVSVYRVDEPRVDSTPDSRFPLPARRLDFRYSDHPHDVEAMYVGPTGDMFFITKRRLLDAGRRPRPALIFRLPSSAWDSSGIVTAALLDSLPIVPGTAPGRQVTDAALSPDGRVLAVRTYSEVFFFAVDSASWLPITHRAPTTCTILGLDEGQGEGVGWWWGRRVVLTSEGRSAPLNVVECRMPE
jgi:hypothetical protein